jgi:phage terminase large subunit-like protein
MLSKKELLASLPVDQRRRVLQSLTEEQRRVLLTSWGFEGRPEQQLPKGDWFVWLILAGRGWGKTRTAVENIARMLRGPSPLIAPTDAPAVLSIIADTPFDMRQYCIEGYSGFLNVGPEEFRPTYEPSKRVLEWPNGCKGLLFSAEDPDTLRGASGWFFWWDELAKSKYASEGWQNMLFGMREGNPRGIVTTTPRPIPLLKELVKKNSTIITKGSTWDNKNNLSEVFYKEVIKPLEGTRVGRQEIHAEILDDVPGALWTREMFDEHRIKRSDMPDLQRVVVAIDPSGTRGQVDSGDEIGIVAAGKGVDGRAYVLADGSCKVSPALWARRAVALYEREEADCIVAEPNYGGAMVEHTIRTVDSRVPYRDVHASRGKVQRAEPIAALYEQGRVSHVGSFALLEDQACQFATDGYLGDGSPDRVDALVWALTELMLTAEVAEAATGTFQMRR